MTLRVLMLALLLAAPSTVSIETVATAKSSSCSGWSSRTSPPPTIRLFRMHHRGSSVPAHIDVVSFKSLRPACDGLGCLAGVPSHGEPQGRCHRHQAIRLVVCPQPSVVATASMATATTSATATSTTAATPGRMPRIKAAVQATWAVSLRKSGRFFRTGWTGGGSHCGSADDGWHLSENAITVRPARLDLDAASSSVIWTRTCASSPRREHGCSRTTTPRSAGRMPSAAAQTAQDRLAALCRRLPLAGVLVPAGSSPMSASVRRRMAPAGLELGAPIISGMPSLTALR